jgi:hypothetical protein
VSPGLRHITTSNRSAVTFMAVVDGLPADVLLVHFLVVLVRLTALLEMCALCCRPCGGATSSG